MNKEDLKKLIKPLVKECVSEILIQEGMRSLTDKREIVREEIQEKRPILQEKTKNKGKIDFNKVFNKEAIEKNKKLGFNLEENAFDPFRGTIPSDELEKMPSPADKKVGSLINESSGEWNRILDAMKARK